MSAPHQTTNSQDTRQKATVQPSTRDPIERWLDVFTGLLAVNARQRERIRDELEDHLRMRAQDLMILGESEPEAVQRAVKELGETAELARRFKEATHQPRRSTIMHSILLAIAGTGLAVGAVTLTGTPTAMPLAAAVGVVQPAQDEIKTLGVDLPAGPLEQALSTVAEMTGTPMFVHWASIENELGVDRGSEVAFIPAKNLAGSKILELINASLGLEGADVIDVRVEENLVEVATRGYFDRLEMVTMDHDVSALVPAVGVLDTTDEAETLRENIMLMVEPELWYPDRGTAATATIAITGSRLSVRAPERVQAQVDLYIAQLKHAATDQLRKGELATKAAREEHNAERLRTAERIRRNCGDLNTEVQSLSEKLERIGTEYWGHFYRSDQLERDYSFALVEEGADSDAVLAQLVQQKARIESIEIERDLLKSRLHAVQDRLMQAEDMLASYQ